MDNIIMIMLNKRPQIFDVSNKALGRLGYMYHLIAFCFKLRLICSDLIAEYKIMNVKSVTVSIEADIGGYLSAPPMRSLEATIKTFILFCCIMSLPYRQFRSRYL